MSLLFAYVISPLSAWAYVDPSVMTYTIQALASVAVVMASIFGVLWRRLKSNLFSSLEIDPDKNKLKEGKVESGDNKTSAKARFASRPGKRKVKTKSSKAERKQRIIKSYPFSIRFLFAFLASACFVFSISFFSPLSLVTASIGEFSFCITDIWLLMLIFSLIISLLLALIISLFKGKAFCIVCTLVFAIGLCFFIQRCLLNYALPTSMGKELDLNYYKKTTVIGLCVWAAVIAICLFISFKKPLFVKYFVGVLASFLIISQSVMLIASVPESLENYDNISVSQKGLYEVSAKSEVEFFILDAFDQKWFNDVLAAEPDILDEFTDFTVYNNATGFFEYTRFASPFLVSSNLPINYTLDDYHNKCTKFYDEINKAGYSVAMYSLDVFDQVPYLQDCTINIGPKEQHISIPGTIKQMLRCGCYRDLPFLLKPSFLIYGDKINSDVSEGATIDGYEEFNRKEDQIYHNLQNNALTINETGEKGTFKYYHLLGEHSPWYWDKNFEPDENADLLSQGICEMKLIVEYIKNLKRLGVYDNTTIILSADHGEQMPISDDMYMVDNPFLLVKPAKSHNPNPTGQPVKFSNLATGHLDVHPTVMDAVGGDISKFTLYGGQSIFTLQPNNRDRIFYKTAHIDGPEHQEFHEYVLPGGKDPHVLENWVDTGNYYFAISYHDFAKKKPNV
ncbi:MAG: sulfatase-like hydrolase/transferase [Coriobacteriales bacterium]|nr:sulfatase-like hydrolase/transferase [Coriobacteriales bacterium]